MFAVVFDLCCKMYTSIQVYVLTAQIVLTPKIGSGTPLGSVLTPILVVTQYKQQEVPLICMATGLQVYYTKRVVGYARTRNNSSVCKHNISSACSVL